MLRGGLCNKLEQSKVASGILKFQDLKFEALGLECENMSYLRLGPGLKHTELKKTDLK